MTKFPLLPRRKNTDKSDYGHVLVLAGSRGMAGAAVLCGRAAMASGAGLVTLGVPQGLQAFISKKTIPEIMVREIATLSSVRRYLRQRRISSIALGPGLSLAPARQKFARAIVRKSPVPVVLDADGLNSFKGRVRELGKRRSTLILTPHAGEFERVFSQALPENPLKRLSLAKKLSQTYDVVLVLKGHRTLVVYREKAYQNRTGNPGMAKGGAGDVLTGIIAAFIAQGLSLYEAARWAVYFHGLAGDLAVRRQGELGLLASDIIECLPKAFKSG